MKKVFIAIIAAVALCSCGTPKFEFALDVKGDVSEAKTCISANFDADVTNVVPTFFSAEEQYFSIESEEGADALKWLDKTINEKFIANLEEGALYDIAVKGYVCEKTTGLKFEVDKTWKNK